MIRAVADNAAQSRQAQDSQGAPDIAEAHDAANVRDAAGANDAAEAQLEAMVDVSGALRGGASCCEVDDMTQGTGDGGLVASFAVDSLFPHRIDVSASPDHVDAGETCGMSWMCGEHPCLCGESDEWGDCACNGTHAVAPAVSVQSSDPGVAVFELGGAWYAFAPGPAEADLAVTASLPHYRDFQQTVHLSCGGPGAGAFVAVALVAALLAACIGAGAAAMRKRRQRESAESQKGATLSETRSNSPSPDGPASGPPPIGDKGRPEPGPAGENGIMTRFLSSPPDSEQRAEGPGDRASCSDGADEGRQDAPATGERP